LRDRISLTAFRFAVLPLAPGVLQSVHRPAQRLAWPPPRQKTFSSFVILPAKRMPIFSDRSAEQNMPTFDCGEVDECCLPGQSRYRQKSVNSSKLTGSLRPYCQWRTRPN
jgi:hypothetical protein